MGSTSLLLLLSLSVMASFAARAPVTNDEFGNLLYNNVIVGDYTNAVTVSKQLESNKKGDVIRNVVGRLLRDSKRNTVEYAYQLWNNNGQDIIREYFPVPLRVIVAGNAIKIINKRDGLALKLAASDDRFGDRLAYGDGSDKTSPRVSWKTVPVWHDNKVYFKIVNNDRSQNLKLENDKDSMGDRRAFGANEDDTQRHQWYFYPEYFEDELLFYIINRQFSQALKLGRDVDSDGDRILYGNHGDVYGQPEIFGWFIEPF